MKMTVRTLMLAAVLVVLGTSSVFGQVVYTIGGPNGSPYNGLGGINLAVNREGNRELLAPVTICSNTAGSGGAAATFDVGDTFQIFYGSSIAFTGYANGTSPLLAATGALGANQVGVFQSAASAAPLTASAVADIFQPPTVPPNPTPPPQSRVTVTVTASPAPGIVGCIVIQNLRFDLGNTTLVSNLPNGVTAGATFGALVLQTTEGAAPLVPVTTVPIGPSTNGVLAPGQVIPTNAQTGGGATPGANAGLGTASTTLGFAGAAGYANGTGCTFTTGTVAAGTAIQVATLNTSPAAVWANPGCPNFNNTGLSLIPVVMQNSGLTAPGSVSAQENAAPGASGPGGGLPVNLGTALGGGLFRNFANAGIAATTLLNLSGATTGTQVEISVSTMPVGSAVTFANTASSASSGAVLTLTLVGSGTITAPTSGTTTGSGVVTYVVTNNEGPGQLVGGGPAVGPSVEIPYTVSEGTSAGATGTARYIIRLRPASTSAETPKYADINGVTTLPAQLSPTVPFPTLYALYNISSNQTTRLFPFVVFNGSTPQSYDTGLAYTNTGKNARVADVTGVASYGGGIPGQDGTFTVFFVSSSGTVTSIRSDDAKFPDGSKILSSGKLKVGDTWLALMSDFVTAGTIKGNFTGSLVVVADFPHSQGFAFISQFTNPSGGATMGYVALQQAR